MEYYSWDDDLVNLNFTTVSELRRILLERGGGGGGEGFGLNDEGLVEEAEGLNTEAERLNPGAERLYPGAENLLVEQDEKVYYSARSDLDLHITNKVEARSLSVSYVEDTWAWVGLAVSVAVIVVGVVFFLLRNRYRREQQDYEVTLAFHSESSSSTSRKCIGGGEGVRNSNISSGVQHLDGSPTTYRHLECLDLKLLEMKREMAWSSTDTNHNLNTSGRILVPSCSLLPPLDEVEAVNQSLTCLLHQSVNRLPSLAWDTEINSTVDGRTEQAKETINKNGTMRKENTAVVGRRTESKVDKTPEEGRKALPENMDKGEEGGKAWSGTMDKSEEGGKAWPGSEEERKAWPGTMDKSKEGRRAWPGTNYSIEEGGKAWPDLLDTIDEDRPAPSSLPSDSSQHQSNSANVADLCLPQTISRIKEPGLPPGYKESPGLKFQTLAGGLEPVAGGLEPAPKHCADLNKVPDRKEIESRETILRMNTSRLVTFTQDSCNI